MIQKIIQLLIIPFIVIVYIEIKKWLIQRKLQNFVSPQQIPIFGVAARMFGKTNFQFINIISDLFTEMKTTFYAWAGPILIIGVSEPQELEILLTNEYCISKPYFLEQFHCKTSIVASNGYIWKRDRRALNTTFNVHTLQSFVPLLNGKSRILVQQMESHLDEPGNVYRTVFIGMIDMVVRTTMGCDMKLQSERGAFLYDIIKIIMHNLQYRIARIWLRWDFVYYSLSKVGRDERRPLKDGNNFVDDIYEMRMNQLNVLKSQGIDYLQEAKKKNVMNTLEKCLLIEQEGVFNRENVLDQMRAILLTGIDTSSIAVFGTLLMLAMNQKHQDLLVDELRSVFESADCDVTQEHLAGMKYTERVIKETLRLLPPVPLFSRKTTADIELPRGVVPKDAMIIFNIIHLHRNPNIWGKNVLEFDPDRFLPENISKRPPFSYIPFAAGLRTCTGTKYAMNSVKITLAHLLRQYKFTSDLCFDDIRLNTHVAIEVANDKPLRVERRHF